MKLTKKIIILLALTLLALTFLTSCGDISGKKSFYIDNPTQETVNVNIDGKDYTLETKTLQKLDLKSGDHKMTLQDGSLVNFRIAPVNEGGIINPTRSLYAIVSMVYAVEGEEDGFAPISTVVYIDGVDYEGSIKTTNDLFIDNVFYRCEYMPRDPFPDTKYSSDENYKGNIVSKYFDKDEFIQFYEEETDSVGYHEENKTNEETVPSVSTVNNIPEMQFKDATLQSYYEEALKIQDNYKNVMTEKEWKDVNAELSTWLTNVGSFGFIEDKEEQDNMEKLQSDLIAVVSARIFEIN